MEKSRYAGIFFTTLSLLMLEITLTRIFSVTMWYHFAFLAVSLAVFGIGTGGLAVHLFPHRFSLQYLHVYSFLCSLSIILVLIPSLFVSIPLDPSHESLHLFMIIYIFCSLPFFFGGLCLASLLLYHSESVSLIYFSDLSGSGMGCLLIIPILNTVGGPPTLLMVALFSFLGTAVFSLPHKKFLSLTMLCLLCVGGSVSYPPIGDQLDIRTAKGFSQSHISVSEWNTLSRVAVFELGAPFPGWSMSSTWTGEVVDNLGMDIDANAFSPIVSYADTRKESLLYDITAVPYHLHPQRVLIIGTGGGRDIVTAQFFTSDITAVEINPLIVSLVNDRYGAYSGHIYDQVDLHIVEGRGFLEHTRGQYDLIQMALVDTWAASASGAYALSEAYLYTVEAFSTCLSRLDDQGVLSVSRWIFDTPQQTLRLVSLAREALHLTGIDTPSDHIIVVRNGRVATFLLKKTPFSTREIQTVEELCTFMNFEIVYTPEHHRDPLFTRLITTDDPVLFYQSYPLDVSPTTDDNPFFFYTIKSSEISSLISMDLESESFKNNVSLLWLGRLLLISFILVLFFFLVVPAIVVKKFVNKSMLAYFALLGLGFMCVEIPLMQKFTLYLGHPTYAVSVVLFSLLISGGAGSFLTRRHTIDIRVVSGYIIVMLCLYTIVFWGGTVDLFQYSWGERMVLAVGMTCALGIAMGMLFPLGILSVSRHHQESIPWMWAINGATSVLGSVIALLVAIHTGFTSAILLGAVSYGCLFLISLFHH
jgi:hypothetical protein